MPKDESASSTLNTALSFFNSKLTAVNTQRQQLNRNKGLAKYLAQSQSSLRSLAPLDNTLSVLSFSLYFLRLPINLSSLAQLLWTDQQSQINDKARRDLYFSIANDSLWAAVNLSQFLWWSFRESQSAGLRGLQFETLAQGVDLVLMLIRFHQDKEDYERQYEQANRTERRRLAIEWHYKELHFIRALATAVAAVLVFYLYSFSIAAVPIAPVLSVVVLLSSLLRVLMDVEKDRQLLHHSREQQNKAQLTLKEEQLQTLARLEDLNQIILNNVLVPLGLYLFLTSPLPITLLASVSLLLIYCSALYLIESKRTLLNEIEWTTDEAMGLKV